MTNKKSVFYIDESKDVININQLINIINNCRGKTFLAHLFTYDITNSNINEPLIFLSSIFNETKIDGAEAYHSTFTEEYTSQIINECKKQKKYISGGSDFHGTNKPRLNLGIGYGNLNVPDDIITPWL